MRIKKPALRINVPNDQESHWTSTEVAPSISSSHAHQSTPLICAAKPTRSLLWPSSPPIFQPPATPAMHREIPLYPLTADPRPPSALLLKAPSNILNAYTYARAELLHLPPLRHAHRAVDASKTCILTPASARRYRSARILGCLVLGCVYESPAATHTAYWSSSFPRTARFALPVLERKLWRLVGWEGLRGSWKALQANHIWVASARIWWLVWSSAGRLSRPVLVGLIFELDVRARE